MVYLLSEVKCIIILIPPVPFYFFNVTTVKLKIIRMTHTFLLENAVPGFLPLDSVPFVNI